MKKTLALILFAAAYLSSFAAFGVEEKPSARPDGYAWKSYHEYVKLGYALGFLQGADKAIRELDPFIRQSYYTEKSVGEILPVYNITNSALKDELDKFYSKEENLPVTVDSAAMIICAEMRPKKDARMIEREKEIQRLRPAEQRVERVKDYIKDEIKKGEYPRYEVKEEKIIEAKTKKEVPLSSEDDATNLWFNMMVPGQGVTVKEVVKKDYSLAIGIGIIALIAIITTITIMKRNVRGKKYDKKGR